MSNACDTCGYRSSDIKAGGGISDKGKTIVLNVAEAEDLRRDVIKADTASVSIPEADLEVTTGRCRITVQALQTRSWHDTCVDRCRFHGPPLRLAAAWGVAWGVHGVCMGCVWGVYGVCMGSAWGVHGVCMGCAWGLHGVCMGCVWGVHGVCMGCVWGLHGVCMGSAWGVHGVCMGCVWGVHGVCMGCAWGLHGVCGCITAGQGVHGEPGLGTSALLLWYMSLKGCKF